MSETSIRDHVRAIQDCNQRGGRMLSLVDLLDAGTVDLPAAAYLAAAMRLGASLLVGAQPGGAGKTAVMCALLNFLPDRTILRPVDHPSVLADAQHDPSPGDICYLAHEIGAGHWYAYVWGEGARAFFRLAAQGHIIASNLHADTLEGTRDQLCRENGVEPAHLDAVTLKLYLRMRRPAGRPVRRWVSHVYESDGTEDRLLWTGDGSGELTRHEESAVVSPEQEETYAEFLVSLRKGDIRWIEDVRRSLVHSLKKG
ncbi:MAG: hypothetical protein ISS56_20625 [Anaerolineae bacterium]|nr:hypothetical protein [Anaerolineae bacterium]